MNINKFKRVALAAAALLMGFSAMAQTTSKQINQIKRSPLYLYAEATMESEEEAQSVAYELLLQQVQEYIASSQMLSAADNVLIKDVKTKGESLSMMRGEMHRVFVYVKKYDIEAVTNTVAVNNNTNTAVNLPAQGMTNTTQSTSMPTVTETPAPAPKASQTQPQQQQQPAATTTGKVESPLTGWQQMAMVSLLECPDMTSVRAKLNRLKAEYKIKRYGNADNCPSAADAYWAIFDSNGKLVTILGPGTTQRIDYKNMQYSSLSEYKGMNALWFNLAK
ncbi:MAG: hypothetical protein J6V98_02155 [Bacteroidales bacterium]|nr:hypothetical protein [Bacteroidales bacterium]